ncbi:MAG: hypothetical protein PVH77_06205 [Phycisphaerales bacterium]|jgi:hypothetical protein
MKEKKELKELLNELTEKTVEPVRSGLHEEIKNQIPVKLPPHKGGLDSIKIIIDLRINKLTAAAAIITTIIFCATFLGDKHQIAGGILQDNILLLKYWGGDHESNISAGKIKYEYLLSRGEEVAWYGNIVNQRDNNSVIIQHKLQDGRYEIFFIDGREKTVNSEELVQILTEMLQKKTK